MKLKFSGPMYSVVYGDGRVHVSNPKNERLGSILKSPKWECHVWLQDNNIQMSGKCLEQVVKRITELDIKVYGRCK